MEITFDNDDLMEMKKKQHGICISIYMNTPRGNIDNKKHFIILKNKLVDIELKLLELNAKPAEIKQFNEDIKRLYNDLVATAKLSNSIAIFYSDSNIYSYPIPMPVYETVDITDEFNITQLENFLETKNKKYYILTLSQNNIKLYQATPYTIEEIKLNNIPNNLEDFLSTDDFERSLEARTSTSKSIGGSSKMFYSSGDKKADTKKEQLLRYFSKVNDGVIEALHDQKEPLILAGVEYLMPIYKKANKYSNLVEGIKGNADKMNIEELHQESLKLI